MRLLKYIFTVLILMVLYLSMTSFGIMCPKCWEKDHIRSIANRSIKDEKTGDTRIVYRCQYGHIIYVDKD